MKSQKSNPYNSPKASDEDKNKLDQEIAKLFIMTKKGVDTDKALEGVAGQILTMLNKWAALEAG